MKPTIHQKCRRGSAVLTGLLPPLFDSPQQFFSPASQPGSLGGPSVSKSPPSYQVQNVDSEPNPKKVRRARLSLKKLAEIDERIQAAVKQAARHSTLEIPKNSPKPRLSKIWCETESELDSLHASLKPRKSRGSFSLANITANLPESSSEPEEETGKSFCLLPWVEKPKKTSPGPEKKVFVNLPKLPFGCHKSYNDETEIRGLIVTKRWKAWRRKRNVKLRREFRKLNASLT